MRRDIHPQQISLFDPLQNRGIIKIESNGICHDYNDIISIENLLISWQEFLRGKKKRKDVAEFTLHFMDNIFLLHEELKEMRYRHGSYQAFRITDPKPRDIHKASVRDRLVHHAICRILYPYFDKKFIYDSYSCRLGKGTHRAVSRFYSFARAVGKNNTKTVWVLKGDIKKFFANIDHKIMKNILAEHIGDRKILWLLGRVIDSFCAKNKIDIGLPLGNLTSQLLVNIYLNEFDQFVKRKLKARYFIRYSDDFVILNEDKSCLESFIPRISGFLKTQLMLFPHPDKVFIKTLASGVDFLGYVVFSRHIILRVKTKRRMFKKITFKKRQFKKGLIAEEQLEQSLRSYMGALKHCSGYKIRGK